MADDMDVAQLEQRLLPKPMDTWTPQDWWAFFLTAQHLVDEYGKEPVLAAFDELALIHGAAVKVIGGAIRHSIRA